MPRARRRFLAPEVVQTSAMDCGPASLKCLLEGHGVSASYGRLREACQTDVDGTSIDTLEEVAQQLGLEAEQIMLPVDHLLLDESEALPAILVVTLPTGVTHFLVAWRRHGPLFQVMDPATGRRWMASSTLLEQVYVHEMPVPAEQWRGWAGSGGFLEPLGARLRALGVGEATRAQLINQAVKDPGWRSLARLDAATRMVASIVDSGALRKGSEATGVLESLMEGDRNNPVIPDESWSATAAPESEDEERVTIRGAVLVRVAGVATASRERTEQQEEVKEAQPPPLSPELAAALSEPPGRPGFELLRFLRADGVLAPTVLLGALALSAGAVLLEALLFRGLLHVSRDLGLSGQRMAALSALALFLLALLLIELPLVGGMLRLGRKLEVRLRLAFLRKIPRLRDRYFQSRLSSDMAERSHSIHQIRQLPEMGGQLLRSGFELIFTAAAIAWLDPRAGPLAALAALLALTVPLLAQPVIRERDLRLRTHGGALTRFYFDALQGLTAVRAHGAERPLAREHEGLLGEWARAGLALQRAVVSVEGLQFAIGFGLAAWLLFDHVGRVGESGTVLLLVYWALNLPVLGQEVGLMARQYPEHRNLTLRLLEPLGAREDTGPEQPVAPSQPAPDTSGIALAFDDVTVRAAGHTILDTVRLEISSGEHVAIVGASGAGKSTFVGTLLGWHSPACGRIHVDGAPLDGTTLERLRREVTWVDPAVHLWNRTFLDNLRYGSVDGSDARIGRVIDAADLRGILERMPEGLQTPLGEGGALVSGGEGQRVRLGRGLHRQGSRLVILDEPFRGLDRDKRRQLLARAREWWSDATLLCVTHDVGETGAFDRVLVVEHGRIVEDGAPGPLSSQEDSRYRQLLDAESAVREGLWSAGDWRRLRLAAGTLEERGRT